MSKPNARIGHLLGYLFEGILISSTAGVIKALLLATVSVVEENSRKNGKLRKSSFLLRGRGVAFLLCCLFENYYYWLFL